MDLGIHILRPGDTGQGGHTVPQAVNGHGAGVVAVLVDHHHNPQAGESVLQHLLLLLYSVDGVVAVQLIAGLALVSGHIGV